MDFLYKLQKLLSRWLLVNINKSFIRTHFNYGHAIFDETYNKSFLE